MEISRKGRGASSVSIHPGQRIGPRKGSIPLRYEDPAKKGTGERNTSAVIWWATFAHLFCLPSDFRSPLAQGLGQLPLVGLEVEPGLLRPELRRLAEDLHLLVPRQWCLSHGSLDRLHCVEKESGMCYALDGLGRRAPKWGTPRNYVARRDEGLLRTVLNFGLHLPLRPCLPVLCWPSAHLLPGGKSVGNDERVAHPEMVAHETVQPPKLAILHLSNSGEVTGCVGILIILACNIV